MDVEHALICKIIQEHDFAPVIQAGISRDFFYDHHHRQVFDRIVEHHQHYDVTPTRRAIEADYPTYKWQEVDEAYPFLIDEIKRSRKRGIIEDGLSKVVDAYEVDDLDEAQSLLSKTVADAANVSTEAAVGRQLILTPASEIRLRSVKWAWQDRMSLGSLGVLAGREGLGKSTLAYWMAAQISRGGLPGHFYGIPRSVLVVAAEDSWAHTIGPRLVAAGADLDRVFRVEIRTETDVLTGLDLPQDNQALEATAVANNAALILLDPLLSRLSGKLDTHKDADVRQALEPLAALADRTNTLVLGIMHFNKTSTEDPLTAVMGSRALVAVPRSVSVIVRHPDSDDGMLAFSTPKNNVGRQTPSLLFKIESCTVITEDGETHVGGLKWCGESEQTAADMMLGSKTEEQGARADAGEFLSAFLHEVGGSALASNVMKAARAEGIAQATLYRAADQIGVNKVRGSGGVSTWWLESPSASSSPLEEASY